MVTKQYRTEYAGEFVITSTIFRAGKKEQEREWVENPIQNKSTNHRACCIAPGPSTKLFPLVHLANHSGGLHSVNKMQLYTAGDVWKEMKADFHVVVEQESLLEIIEENFQVDNIIYTNTSSCIANPGEFYLIPHGVNLPVQALAVWIACFDGHKDIYLHGYDVVDGTVISQKIIEAVRSIMETYNDVIFHHVTNGSSPDIWRKRRNLKTLSVRKFITSCDI